MQPDSAERHQQLSAAARAFRDDDLDPDTRAEIDALLARSDAGAIVELEDRFGSALAFGTAGLRGLVGAGDNRMNRRVVARTTAGLCAYLAGVVPDAQRRGICLGYDGRHGSRAFADEVAAVTWGFGFVVHRFEELVPTPLLAFSVLERGAAAGVMITASHNPAAYNGYKVYLWDGAQLASPHDCGIQGEIATVSSVAGLQRRTHEEARAAGLARTLDGVEERYLNAVVAAVGRGSEPLQLKAAYTPLHGVGRATAERVFEHIGARDVQSVPEQADPDPEFPTVAFPNPEEPGALDRVLAFGERIGAAVAIANDPDADRLALAARDASGRLAAFSGNEIGVLLADHLLARAPRDGKNLVVSTIVSTPLLERIVREHGASCVRTLTGFKWIIGRALELDRSHGLRLVLGFEEALGYCIGSVVRDKDGIAAAAHALHMAEVHAAAGRTLHDALEGLYRRYGLCCSSQISFTRPGVLGGAEIADAMARLRANPPSQLAGIEVRSQRDLALGSADLPPSDVVVIELAGEHRITTRPSGTEPKLKVYLDVWVGLAPEAPLPAAQAEARLLAARLQTAIAEQLGF